MQYYETGAEWVVTSWPSISVVLHREASNFTTAIALERLPRRAVRPKPQLDSIQAMRSIVIPGRAPCVYIFVIFTLKFYDR